MTTVNWERASGDLVEEIIAAFILLDNPRGNRITPSRGDKGIDVQVEVDGRWNIYQIKKFAHNLTTSQKNQIQESWDTFVAETLPHNDIRSWTLVLPWDPTREQLAWLHELTEGHNVDVQWWGRAQLDGLASQRPDVVDYYFGDGGREVKNLMAQMLALNSPLSAAADRPSFLAGLSERLLEITRALSQLDPFYKYVVDLRTGTVGEWNKEDAQGAAFVQYLQVTDEQYTITRLFPLSAESWWLHPIGGTLALDAPEGSEEAGKVSDFFDYGTPFTNVPGELIDVHGPPGLVEAGPGLFSTVLIESTVKLHPLELQLANPTNEILERLPLTNVTGNGAPQGHGMTIEAQDLSGTLSFRFRTNARDREIFDFRFASCVGKSPAAVLPAIRFLARLDGANPFSLAVRGGRPVLAPMIRENPTRQRATEFMTFLDDLVLIQQYSDTAITIPDLSRCTHGELHSVQTAAKVLRGETATWNAGTGTFRSDAIDPNDPAFSVHGQVTVAAQEPIAIILDGHRTELDAWMTVVSMGTVIETEGVDSDGFVTLKIDRGVVTAEMISPEGSDDESAD